MHIRELQKLLTNKQFNPYININNPDLVFIHLIEEIGELARQHFNMINMGNNFLQLQKECGDILILLSFYCSSMDIDLQHSTFLKLQDNIIKGKFQPTVDFQDKLRGLFNEK